MTDRFADTLDAFVSMVSSLDLVIGKINSKVTRLVANGICQDVKYFLEKHDTVVWGRFTRAKRYYFRWLKRQGKKLPKRWAKADPYRWKPLPKIIPEFSYTDIGDQPKLMFGSLTVQMTAQGSKTPIEDQLMLWKDMGQELAETNNKCDHLLHILVKGSAAWIAVVEGWHKGREIRNDRISPPPF